MAGALGKVVELRATSMLWWFTVCLNFALAGTGSTVAL